MPKGTEHLSHTSYYERCTYYVGNATACFESCSSSTNFGVLLVSVTPTAQEASASTSLYLFQDQ